MAGINLYFLMAVFVAIIPTDLQAKVGDNREALSKRHGEAHKIKGKKNRAVYLIQIGEYKYAITVVFEKELGVMEIWQRIDAKELEALEVSDIVVRICGVVEWVIMKDPDKPANDKTTWLWSKKANLSVRITSNQVIVQKGKVKELVPLE